MMFMLIQHPYTLPHDPLNTVIYVHPWLSPNQDQKCFTDGGLLMGIWFH